MCSARRGTTRLLDIYQVLAADAFKAAWAEQEESPCVSAKHVRSMGVVFSEVAVGMVCPECPKPSWCFSRSLKKVGRLALSWLLAS